MALSPTNQVLVSKFGDPSAFVSNSSLSMDHSANSNCYGSGFLKQERPFDDDYYREFKLAKISQEHHQLLNFNTETATPLPSYHPHMSSACFSRHTGNGHTTSLILTPSQWMELEHQALIYKYITANVPVPSFLLNPITKSFESAGFSTLLRSNPLGWRGYQLGLCSRDPEPGRCRRTDGKKWRCSRDTMPDQKYCERHMNRGRHRSRKPVEGHRQSGHTTTTAPSSSHLQPTQLTLNRNGTVVDNEFGAVCSDSLLNPLNKSHHLSICIPSTSTELADLEMGLGMGGPLGEALNTNMGRGQSSPTGVLQTALSNSSSPTESANATFFVQGLMNSRV